MARIGQCRSGTTDAPLDVPATYRVTDFNFDENAARPATLTLGGQESTSVSGQLMSAGAVDAVGATYAEISTAPTVTTTLAGTYAGYIRTIGRRCSYHRQR